MPTTKITDLLPIPKGTRDPHAYQVFALEDGEQDLKKITQAVQATITRLKAAKSSTDADLWGKAARLVQRARVTLADPEKKAQLDARFGIIPIDDNGQPPESKSTEPVAIDPLAALLPSTDPLAGVLPSADPLAAVLPTADPLAAAPRKSSPPAPGPTDNTNAHVPSPQIPSPQIPSPQAATPVSSMPPGVFGSPAPEPAAAVSVAAAPVVVKPKKVRRRKNSAVSMLIFSVFALGMFGLIGGLGYFVLSDGQLAITSTDGQITISTQKVVDDRKPQVGPPGPVSEKRPRPEHDPVMGKLAGDVPLPNRPPQPSGLVSGIESLSPPTEPAMESPQEEPASEPATNPEPVSEPEAMQPLTDEMIADADKSLERVRTLIRDANWVDMKAVAEAASEARMNDQQNAEAEALYELADLATYYRGGIERAVAKQSAGNEIVVKDIPMIVVQAGDDLLVVRLNPKNSKSFTIDKMPFSLAHVLASYEVSPSPTAEAAKAVYQAIAPKTNEGYRDEAIQWLREIDGEVEGVDPQRMAETIEALFANPDNA